MYGKNGEDRIMNKEPKRSAWQSGSRALVSGQAVARSTPPDFILLALARLDKFYSDYHLARPRALESLTTEARLKLLFVNRRLETMDKEKEKVLWKPFLCQTARGGLSHCMSEFASTGPLQRLLSMKLLLKVKSRVYGILAPSVGESPKLFSHVGLLGLSSIASAVQEMFKTLNEMNSSFIFMEELISSSFIKWRLNSLNLKRLNLYYSDPKIWILSWRVCNSKSVQQLPVYLNKSMFYKITWSSLFPGGLLQLYRAICLCSAVRALSDSI